MTSEKSFLAKQCGMCQEKMPAMETMCYCGGPVSLIRLPLEEKSSTSYYYGRKWLAVQRQREKDARRHTGPVDS